MKLTSRAFLIAILLVLVSGMAFGSPVAAAETPQQSEFVPPIAIVNTSFLNVRTGPGVYFTILITLVGGTELPVLGIAPDGVWYEVSTVAGVGWLNSEFVLPRGDFRNVPTVEPPEPEVIDPFAEDDTLGEGMMGSVSCELTKIEIKVDLAPSGGPNDTGDYRQPQDSRLVKGGETGYLLDKAFGFFKVLFMEGNVGWIAEADGKVLGTVDAVCGPQGTVVMDGNTVVSDIDDYDPATGMDGTDGGQPSTMDPNLAPARVVVNTGNLNLRSGPGAQYSVVQVVPGGTVAAVIGFAPDGVWYLVEGPFGRGWLNSTFTVFRGDGRNVPIIRDAVGILARPVATVTNAVTLYAAPDITLGSVGALSGPLELPVVARTTDGSWVQLDTPLGYGWLPAAQVTIEGDLGLAPVVG